MNGSVVGNFLDNLGKIFELALDALGIIGSVVSLVTDVIFPFIGLAFQAIMP